jgi:hypothetical protein
VALLQSLAVPAGLVDQCTPPELSLATHSDADAQDTPRSVEPMSTGELQEPAAGSLEVSTFPAVSTATQNEVEGHDTALSVFPLSISVALQEPPFTGFVEVKTWEPCSTATHRPAVGHEISLLESAKNPKGLPPKTRPLMSSCSR